MCHSRLMQTIDVDSQEVRSKVKENTRYRDTDVGIGRAPATVTSQLTDEFLASQTAIHSVCQSSFAEL